MRMLPRFLVFASICISAIGLSQDLQHPFLDHAFRVELNEEGLRTVATEIALSSLQPIVNLPIPNQESEVEFGIKAFVEDAWFSLAFENVDLRADDNGLWFSAGIKDVVVHANRIILKKKVLNGTIRTTCQDTDIYVGRNQSQTFRINLRPYVAEGVIHNEIGGMDFNISSDEFDVSGPRRCSGEIGIGSVIRSLVHKTLESSRDQIESSVKSQARKAVPGLTDILNETLHQSIELDLSGNPTFPSQGIRIDAAPFSLAIGDNRLSMLLRVDAATPIQSLQKPAVSPVRSQKQGVEIGSLGLNPTMIQEVLAAAFPTGSNWFELTNATAPGVNEILKVSSAASIWPDLLETAPEAPYLRLWVKVDQMPEFASGSGNKHIVVTLPSVQLAFQIQKNGAWIDYYKFRIAVRASAQLSILNQKVAIALSDRPNLQVGGDWAATYQPVVPEVELDVAEAMLQSVLDFVYYRGPLFQSEMPKLPLSSGQISLELPSVRDEFVEVQLHR